MSAFYFVGSLCEVGGVGAIRLAQFGQRVELTDELAKVIVTGGGAIIPEDKFKEIGFTDQELKDYAHPGPRESAPEDFKARVRLALTAVHDFRQSLEEQKEASE